MLTLFLENPVDITTGRLAVLAVGAQQLHSAVDVAVTYSRGAGNAISMSEQVAAAAESRLSSTMGFCPKTLDELPRKQLQTLAQRHGVKANSKSTDTMKSLREIAAESLVEDEEEKSPYTPLAS